MIKNKILNQKAILFGAGGVGLMAFEYFGEDKVECFLDNNKDKEGALLCGKPIISFKTFLEKYANKEGFRCYITTDTFFNELADQLNKNSVYNYSFFRDFIPDFSEVKNLIDDRISADDSVAIVGTTNSTELVLAAIGDREVSIFDYDNSKYIGLSFYGNIVQPISKLLENNKFYSKVIITIPEDFLNSKKEQLTKCNFDIIFANEAIKYLSDEYLRLHKKMEEIDPEKILSSKRMDVIARYLFFKSILNNDEDDYYKSLYARSILMWNNADERIGVFSARSKKNVEEHVNAVKKLLLEMQERGFDKNKYIPRYKGVLLDGAHRLAAALALNEKVWVREIQNKPNPVDFNWFINNGFTLRDKIELLRGFADLYKNCGIFMVFSPSFKNWNYILSTINKRMTYVGHVDLDFSNNFYAFENLINETYHTYEGNFAMKRKIHMLMRFPLKVRIVLVSDENDKNHNLYGYMTQTKLELRDNLTFDVPAEEWITIHGSDNYSEFVFLKEILLSFNNFKQMIRRVTPTFRHEYLSRLDLLKILCKEKNIPIQNVCVVSGASLEGMGIRQSDDIDAIAAFESRMLLGTNSTYKFNDEVEIVSSGRMRNENGVLISDDSVIFDYNKYYIINGVKVVNLEYTKWQKLGSNIVREKDLRDVRLIDIFEDFSLYFDSTNELKKMMKSKMPIDFKE